MVAAVQCFRGGIVVISMQDGVSANHVHGFERFNLQNRVDTDLMWEPLDQRAPSEAPEAWDHAGRIQRIERGWDHALAACQGSSRTDDGIREAARQMLGGTRIGPSGCRG